MDASAVAEYLKQHPEFFEDYADVLAEIFVPHPHGGHAIPIAERQILSLRDRSREQERRLAELVSNAGENEAIVERLHRTTLALMAARDLETTIAVLVHSLKEDFAVPRVAIRLWRDPAAIVVEVVAAAGSPGAALPPAALPELAPMPPALHEFAEGLGAPRCGPAAGDAARAWFEDDDSMKSYAYLPLRTEATFGILALASPDAQRFHPAMGTMYLLRLGELASVAVARCLAPA
ncbi:MAG: DUF484 family protein [Proteobacteria bacterium]|jgi:uncharacterized protein YigA (DUF484 family)|nr:DUF484 family protein [Pseudomonadota bacterium]